MKKIVILSFVLTLVVVAQTISPITPQIQKRMLKGKSWRKGCPVALKDLRYLRLQYLDFQGKQKRGEMIVHREVSKEVVAIFERLHKRGYPIRQMRLVSDFGGNDWQSIEADNTSAFNCRNATGSKKYSKHAYGKAIDINPIENPYISRNGHISHQASQKYRKRVHQNDTYEDKALLLNHDKAVKLFKEYGWKWGGEWHGLKDYQHFSR